MSRSQEAHVAFYSPNILNVCVDKYENGDFSGRMFHRYSKEPQVFHSMIDLTNQMDAFFDWIAFPQASVQTRTFADEGKPNSEKTMADVESPVETGGNRKTPPEKTVSLEEMMENRGQKGTFFISVRYRQKACWQGELEWAERKKTKRFVSLLDMVKLINNVVEESTGQN